MMPMKSSTSHAANTIRDLIITGKLQPNEIIALDDLCRRYSLLKNHAAEGCAILENEGFVTYSPEGPVVRYISAEEIGAWLNKRFSLELDIVEKLAADIDEAKLAIIKQDLKEQGAAVLAGDVVKFLEMNADFHYHLASLAGFPTAAHWFKLESARLKINEIKALDTTIKFRNCYDEHVAIVKSLESRQPEIARNAMKIHLERTAERISAK